MGDDGGTAQRPMPGTVDVVTETDPPHIATISLLGDCDISTAPQLTDALARTRHSTHTLIDLCDCTFIDSTIVGFLYTAQREAEARGGRLAVVVPSNASSVVTRVFDLMRLRDVLSVHDTVEGARAALRCGTD